VSFLPRADPASTRYTVQVATDGMAASYVSDDHAVAGQLLLVTSTVDSIMAKVRAIVAAP